MAKQQRARAKRTVPIQRPRATTQRQPLRIVRGPITPPIPKAVPGHRVTNIVQFKNRNTGKYLIAVYTMNPRTQREERAIVNPKTLSPEQLQQLREWHKHHKSKGSWIHAIATDPHTWATIGKILLAA